MILMFFWGKTSGILALKTVPTGGRMMGREFRMFEGLRAAVPVGSELSEGLGLIGLSIVVLPLIFAFTLASTLVWVCLLALIYTETKITSLERMKFG